MSYYLGHIQDHMDYSWGNTKMYNHENIKEIKRDIQNVKVKSLPLYVVINDIKRLIGIKYNKRVDNTVSLYYVGDLTRYFNYYTIQEAMKELKELITNFKSEYLINEMQSLYAALTDVEWLTKYEYYTWDEVLKYND